MTTETTAGESPASETEAPDTADQPTGMDAPRDGDDDSRLGDDVPGDDVPGRGDPAGDQGADADSTPAGDADDDSRSMGHQIEIAHVAVNGMVMINSTAEGGATGVADSSRLADSADLLLSGPVSERILAELSQAFVPSSRHGRLEQAVATKRIVVLRAVPGWGRSSAALHALNGLRRHDREVGSVQRLDLGPEADVSRLDSANLPAHAPLLLDDPPLADVAGLRHHHFERISSALERIHSYLIVIVPADVRFAEDLGDHLVDGGAPPDALDLLAAHLAVRTDTDRETTRVRLSESDQILRILDRLTADGPRAAAVADVARRIAEWGETPAALNRVEESVERHSVAGVDDWLSGMDVDQFTFAAALAVLNGMPYRTLTHAAALLLEQLRAGDLLPAVAAAPSEIDRAPAIAHLGRSRTTRVQETRARLTSYREPTGHGVTRGEAIEYVDDSYPRRVLEWAWKEHVSLQPVLLAWLTTLSEDRQLSVRVRAATATGVLSTFAFDAIRRDLWLEWSQSEQPKRREAVVAALREPAVTPELALHVRRMLAAWRTHTRSPWRLWTAARAWGAAVGRTVPLTALDELAALAGVPDSKVLAARSGPALRRAVSQSVFELFDGADAERQCEVVRTLAVWAADENASVRWTAFLCFVQLIRDATVAGLPDAESWPALLSLVYEGRLDADLVANLLVLSITTRDLRSASLSGLRTWAVAAEHDSRLIDTLTEIFRRAMTSDSEINLFAGVIYGWRETTPGLCRRLAEMVDQIAEPA